MNLKESLAVKTRSRRSDVGQSRLPDWLITFLDTRLWDTHRPRFVDFEKEIKQACASRGGRAPARTTLYNYFAVARAPSVEISSLPKGVRQALYNLDPGGSVPLPQLAFYCFNYGTLDAISFASGLPWLALVQADKIRGWRPKSHALFKAVLKGRGL